MLNFDRKLFLGIAGTIALAIGAASTASAAPVAGTIYAPLFNPPGSGANDGVQTIHGATSWDGWYSASLYLIGGPTNILVEYLGKEAADKNTFTFTGPGVGNVVNLTNTTGGFTTNAGGFGSGIVNNVGSGILDFGFGAVGGSVTNAANDLATVPNFFISFATSGASSGSVAYLWLDDTGGGPDDNHDDMVIRLSFTGKSGTFSAVPLPAAAWLIFAGIGGLGLVSRRRQA